MAHRFLAEGSLTVGHPQPEDARLEPGLRPPFRVLPSTGRKAAHT
ncbi:MAG: hypothetical protein P8Y72_15595 [Anaerolineales bacterium]